MSLLEANNKEESEKTLLEELKFIASEIRTSWARDCDKTDSMIKLNNFLLDILKNNDSLEEALNQDEKILQYFMTEFMKDVIYNITIQPIVYGENGDDIALELLINIYKLFLKFHKNTKYSPLFEKIRNIINIEKGNSRFFAPPNKNKNDSIKIDNPKRRYNYYKFNNEFYSECIDKEKENENILKEGEKIDALISYTNSRNHMDKNVWIRGKIKSINRENYCYIIESPELDDDINVEIGSSQIVPEGTMTKDWEWRKNLKKYDVIDCYDRNRWYPSTVMGVNENFLKNGYKRVSYHIGFRIYPKFFKNENDENDKYENYKCFWPTHNNLEMDEREKEEYFGDKINIDETIDCYSKRIQKFQSYTSVQKEYLNCPTYYSSYGVNSNPKNKMEEMNYNLENDGEKKEENNSDMIIYEKNGKKNYIVGKHYKFSYYFALFLKKLADENAFEDFIKIINNKPNSEEIFNIFYTLNFALPYIHKKYLEENFDNFRKGIIDFINNLDTKEIRNLPKDLIETIVKFLKKVAKIIKPENKGINENNEKEVDAIAMIEEITISLSIKMIKTSIFDKRIQGIKALNDYINENNKNEKLMKVLIELIQKNEIIKEIFGANYHSQIISKSDKILSLLLKNNEVKEDDIKLIWDCTQRGDLEAKSTIMKLLSDLAENLNEKFIDILLKNIINTIDKNQINEKEIDFIYNLSIHAKNDNNKIKCCEYLYQCVLKLELDDNIKKNPIMENLVKFAGKDDKFLSIILNMCENDLKANNSSLIVLQILAEFFDKYTISHTKLIYIKDNLEDFTKNDKLLDLFKNNFNDYISRIKKQIKLNNNNKISEENGKIGNFDEVILDNYSHAINIQKRMEFLNNWIIQIYPSFDFVPFLKEILLDNPVSLNDSEVFNEYMKKYISDYKQFENEEQKKRKEEIKKQLFKIFVENNQSSMTMSEFELFIAIFFGINNSAFYTVDKDGNYNITLFCDNAEDLKELDKLWNVIFQIKDEKVLNKAISVIFKIYKSKEQVEKLMNKCNDLIKDEKSTNEIIDKCFSILRIIIIESEKKNIIKTKSHTNLTKNSLAYFPLKLNQKYASFFYSNSINDRNEQNENISEILYGNTTINEIKELLIQKSNIPLKYIEVSLSKEYLTKLKEEENKEKPKENKNEEVQELLLDETYNNKSIIEILNNNYNIDLTLNKIFIFNYRIIEKANLLEGDELNPKFKQILKEWFNEFTEGTGKMDQKACANYISRVTAKETVSENDERIDDFFKEYDPEKLGYVTEDKFIEFYLKCLKERKDITVWDNIKSMGIREDLHKKNEPEIIEYTNNNLLPRYCLGNDKVFIDTLFNLFNKLENRTNTIEFLFFLSTNKELYDYILNDLNKKDENNFEKIFVENSNILKQLYILTIIESIIQDININNIDFTEYFEDLKKKDKREETHLIMKSIYYEYFDDIDIKTKKEFVKQFIFNHNYEKLIKYMNNLLIDYKFEENKNNIILNKCCKICLKIINILYEACFKNPKINKKDKNEDAPNNYGILFINQNNLTNIFCECDGVKENISQINFTDFTLNIIKFIINLNYNLNSENNSAIEYKNLLHNSYSLLITLISSNEKLLEELETKEEIKQKITSLIKSFLTCKNENYKIFYIKCLINSINNYFNESNNKSEYLNLLFEISNGIFNEMMEEQSNIQEENIPSKSSLLFFDFFSLLISTKADNEGNEFLFTIYNILFTYLKEIENEKKVSNEIFIGLMNILIKKIKANVNFKNIIIDKKIEGKTLIEMILEKIFKNEEQEKDSEAIEVKTEEKNSEFINLDLIKQEKSPKANIINKEIKDTCNAYLIECFKSSQNKKIIHELYSIIQLLNSKKKNNEDNKENGNSSISTKNFDHVGLKNIGCICYMNSIMQQMYMVPTFRYAIMGSDDHESPKPSEYGRLSIDDDNLLHQLQTMYTFLTFSEKEDYNPKYFCYSFKDFDGNPTNPMIQQDSQEFYNNFCDKIENCLKKTKYKYIINDVFTGTTCSSVICESCKNVSNRFEDFYNLSMEVKNLNNLNDSLQKMIMPEKIDDFKCSNCNKNVTISKRTSLCDLPNVLVIHLKRFYMNYEIERSEKINSRFEFPLNINLKKFCIEDIISQISENNVENENIYVKDDDYYNYVLKGINIHLGSADGGHYFSLINVERDGKGNILLDSENNKKKYKWLKFNDSHISIFNINDIEKECFGGSSKGSSYHYENFQNAYMLVYERKRKAPIRILYDEDELKGINKEDNNENKIKINSDNRKKIKKQFDLFKNNSNVDEKSFYNKLFNDEEKHEYYKYIPYYSIGKFAQKKLYEQVMEKNIKIEKARNNSEESDEKYRKEYYEILLNNITSDMFNILSDEYDIEIKDNIITIFIEIIFNLSSNKFATEEEKININSKTKIILEKLIMPFIESCIKDSKHEENYQNIITIKNNLMQSNKLEKIYINDLTAVFNNDNVQQFSRIIKSIMEIYFEKNESQYLEIIEVLFSLIQSIDSTSTYPTVLNSETNKAPLYYIYEMLYQAALNDKKTTKKLVRQSAISTLLGKLTNENVLGRSIILDIVTHLIKSLDEYNDKLFDIKENILKCDNYFHEKTYLSKNITWSFLEVLFEERLELLIILIKMMQYNEYKFSLEFNIEYIFQLFEYSFQKNKIMDMIKILFGILEINDRITFNRINSILGYPTMIIKQIKNHESEKKEKFEEKKDNAVEETEKHNTNKNYWPLFGERLILEEDGTKDNNTKLKKHIFKYLSIFHNNPNYCLLALLFPEKNNDNGNLIEENERIKLIYDLLKLMLLGRGNYCLFKYVYLIPARSIYYNNLYEEMIDVLENENKINNNLFNLEEIKKNADICIKRINYEIEKAIKYLDGPIFYDNYLKKEEYKLPEKMQKYYVKSDEVEKFIGVNPNFIQSDIVKEKITIIASGTYMFLIRLEYFTKYKTQEEIRNNLKSDKKEELEEDKNQENNKEKDIKGEKDHNSDSNPALKKNINDTEINSDDDNDRILKYDISEIKKEIDGKDFMFDIFRKMSRNSFEKVIIEDSSITNKNKIKSTLIRFIIISSQNVDNDMHIKLMEKDIPDDVKENYYYPNFFIDSIKQRNISNFLNINRIRSELPFLKPHHIGINIDIKKPKE